MEQTRFVNDTVFARLPDRLCSSWKLLLACYETVFALCSYQHAYFSFINKKYEVRTSLYGFNKANQFVRFHLKYCIYVPNISMD